MEALFAAWADEKRDAEVSVVTANHNDLQPLAERYDVPFHDLGHNRETPDKGETVKMPDEYDADLIVLAHYTRLLGPEAVLRCEDHITNIGPSLLPAFPGAEAYRQARDEGVRVAGVIAHDVTTSLDRGPIIITQRSFNVAADADL